MHGNEPGRRAVNATQSLMGSDYEIAPLAPQGWIGDIRRMPKLAAEKQAKAVARLYGRRCDPSEGDDRIL